MRAWMFVLSLSAGCVKEEYVPAYAVSAPATAAPVANLLVTSEKRVDRPTELIGVLDFHSDARNEDKGFEELRLRAAAMGGDAVIDAEFEHGENGGPSHLSGMVVRYR